MNTAMIIDDDELDLELLRMILDDEGYRVLSTADGPRGIEMYKEHRPSIVFLDLGLPTMSGIDVLKDLRAYDPASRIVLITGYGSIESAVAAMKYGAIDFIEKSTDAGEMIRRILRVLDTLGESKAR